MLKLISVIGFSFVLLTVSGCASYHVLPDTNLRGEPGYKIIDKALKNDIRGATGDGIFHVGADAEGFTVRVVTSESEHAIYGLAKSYTWSEIKDVRVKVDLLGLILLGALDPTRSHVVLKLNDGSTVSISGKADEPLHVLAPFWLFDSSWYRAHNLGKAFQSIVDSLNPASTSATSGEKP